MSALYYDRARPRMAISSRAEKNMDVKKQWQNSISGTRCRLVGSTDYVHEGGETNGGEVKEDVIGRGLLVIACTTELLLTSGFTR